jgi:hypothetical protein
VATLEETIIAALIFGVAATIATIIAWNLPDKVGDKVEMKPKPKRKRAQPRMHDCPCDRTEFEWQDSCHH